MGNIKNYIFLLQNGDILPFNIHIAGISEKISNLDIFLLLLLYLLQTYAHNNNSIEYKLLFFGIYLLYNYLQDTKQHIF